MATICLYKKNSRLEEVIFLLAAPKEHICRLESQGLWGEVISFMRPTIRVGGKTHKQISHYLGLKQRIQTAVKSCWEDILWDEVIILSIRQYERKGQLAPLEQQPQHREPCRGHSLQ